MMRDKPDHDICQCGPYGWCDWHAAEAFGISAAATMKQPYRTIQGIAFEAIAYLHARNAGRFGNRALDNSHNQVK